MASATTKPTRLLAVLNRPYSYKTIKKEAFTGYILTKQENKSISRKFWEYFEKGERDKIGNELWAKNFKVHFTGSKPSNIEDTKENIMKMKKKSYY